MCHVRRPLQSGERTPENRGHPEKTGGRGQRHRGPGVGAWSLRVKNWGGGRVVGSKMGVIGRVWEAGPPESLLKGLWSPPPVTPAMSSQGTLMGKRPLASAGRMAGTKPCEGVELGYPEMGVPTGIRPEDGLRPPAAHPEAPETPTQSQGQRSYRVVARAGEPLVTSKEITEFHAL